MVELGPFIDSIFLIEKLKYSKLKITPSGDTQTQGTNDKLERSLQTSCKHFASIKYSKVFLLKQGNF